MLHVPVDTVCPLFRNYFEILYQGIMRFDCSVSMHGHQNCLGEVGPHDPTAAAWLSSGQPLLKLEPCHLMESELSVDRRGQDQF